jgi:hypothetical protein
MRVGYNQTPFWTYYSWENFSRIKPIAWVLREAEKHDGPASDESERLLGAEGHTERDASAPTRLLKRLGPADLIFYGVGSTVGAGIYSLLGSGLAKAGMPYDLSWDVPLLRIALLSAPARLHLRSPCCNLHSIRTHVLL